MIGELLTETIYCMQLYGIYDNGLQPSLTHISSLYKWFKFCSLELLWKICYVLVKTPIFCLTFVFRVHTARSDLIFFLSLRHTKMTSDFILSYFKKVIGGATTQKYQRQIQKLCFFTMNAPPGVSGVSKNPKDQNEDHSLEFQH